MVGHMLLLNNSKPYMESPMTQLHFTLSDLERSKSRSPRFWAVGDLFSIYIFVSSLLPP